MNRPKLRYIFTLAALTVATAACGSSAATNGNASTPPSCVLEQNMHVQVGGNPLYKEYDFANSTLLYINTGSGEKTIPMVAIPFSQLSPEGQATAAQLLRTMPVQCGGSNAPSSASSTQKYSSCILEENEHKNVGGNALYKEYDFSDGVLLYINTGSGRNDVPMAAVPLSQLSPEGQATAAQLLKTMSAQCGGSNAPSSAPSAQNSSSCILEENLHKNVGGNPLYKEFDFADGVLLYINTGSGHNDIPMAAVPFSQLSPEGQATAAQLLKTMSAQCGGNDAPSNISGIQASASCILEQNMHVQVGGNPLYKEFDFADGVLLYVNTGSGHYDDYITALPLSQLSPEGQATAAQLLKTMSVQCGGNNAPSNISAPFSIREQNVKYQVGGNALYREFDSVAGVLLYINTGSGDNTIPMAAVPFKQLSQTVQARAAGLAKA